MQKFSAPPRHRTVTLDYARYEIEVEVPLLIKAYIKFRFRSGKYHHILILVCKAKTGIDSICEYYCTCKSVSRTGDCCSHIMTIVWYLGYAQYEGAHIPNRRRRKSSGARSNQPRRYLEPNDRPQACDESRGRDHNGDELESAWYETPRRQYVVNEAATSLHPLNVANDGVCRPSHVRSRPSPRKTRRGRTDAARLCPQPCSSIFRHKHRTAPTSDGHAELTDARRPEATELRE